MHLNIVIEYATEHKISSSVIYAWISNCNVHQYPISCFVERILPLKLPIDIEMNKFQKLNCKNKTSLTIPTRDCTYFYSMPGLLWIVFFFRFFHSFTLLSIHIYFSYIFTFLCTFFFIIIFIELCFNAVSKNKFSFNTTNNIHSKNRQQTSFPYSFNVFQ